MSDEAVRCGYSKCRTELPPPGPQGGRRRSFCRDTRWPGDRTCAQMAKAERDALDALGLDSGRSAFRLDADRLREYVDAVRVPVADLAAALNGVMARLEEVEDAALSAVETANRGAGEAEAARVEAQQAKERTERDAREARAQAARAVEDRSVAVERASAAARQALEATEALGAARQVAEEAAAGRQAAEERGAIAMRQATAAEHGAQAAAVRAGRADAEREAAQARADEWRVESERQGAELVAVRDELSACSSARTDATTRAAAADEALSHEREARQALEQELIGVQVRLEAETALRERADGELERLRAEAERARTEVGRVREELATLRQHGVEELRTLITTLRSPEP